MFALAVSIGASAAPRVAVVRIHGQNDPEGLEPRLRAELEGEGFEVVMVAAEQAPTREELEATARRTDAFAAIALIRPEGSLAVDVWVTDRVTGKTVLRRIDAPPTSPEAGAIMALRAVELLRASLIELNLKLTPKGEIEPAPAVEHFAALPKPAPAPAPKRPRKPRAVRPEPVPPPPVAPVNPEPSRFAFGIGLAGVGTPGGLGVSGAPSARISWRATRGFGIGIRFVGPALRTLDGAEGSATVDQELALAEAELAPWPGALEPLFEAGVGAYRISARGSAAGSFQGQSASAVSFAAALGLGTRIALSRAISLVPDFQLGWLAPEPVIHFAGRREASAGHPLLVGALRLEVGW